MPLIRCDHRLVLKVSNHRNENSPSLNLFADSKECAALPVIDFKGLESLSHLFDLVLHLIYIHLGPLEFHVYIEPVLTLFYVFP